MKGVFINNKTSVVYNIFGMVVGIVLMLAVPFLCIVDDSITFETIFGLTFFAFLGLIVAVVCIASLLFNKGAYLTADENGISASFGWKSKLKCEYPEIAFIKYGINSLTIILNNKKIYTILKLSNAYEICKKIRKNIDMLISESTTKEDLQNELSATKRKRTKWAVLTASFVGIMFLLIWITVILTDEKEMHEFTQYDWTIFITFIVSEVFVFIAIMFFANKCGRLNLEINEKKSMLKKEILRNESLPTGNLLNVYMDCDYTTRVVIFGYPNAEAVYFIVQVIDEKYNLITTYSSKVFSNIEEIKPMLDELIQIS